MIPKLLMNIQIMWIMFTKERKTLIVSDDKITDMFSNKKLNPIITEFFFRGRK